MKRIIIFLVILVALLSFLPANKLYADEYYEFFQIMCNDDLNFFYMTRVGIWNKGNYIWPTESTNVWKQHVTNLKKLENKYGLYVLDDAHGYYDNNAINYSLNSAHKTDIKIEYDKGTRPSGPIGSKQPYKSNPRLKIHYDGEEVAAFNLNIIGTDYEYLFVDEVSVNDMYSIVVLRVCVVEDPFDSNGKYRRRCSETTLSNKSVMFDNSKIIAIMNKQKK